MFTFGAKPNPKIAIVPGQIRFEKAASPQKRTVLPSKVRSQQTQRSEDHHRHSHPSSRLNPAASERLDPNTSRKRKATRQRSPVQQKFDESSSDDDDVGSPASTTYNFPEKRPKSCSTLDLKRSLRVERPFSEADGKVLIHAADVANRNDQSISVELQYPAALLREKYRTFLEKNKDDKVVLRPVDELITISEIVTNTYLTAEQKAPFTEPDPNPGILRKLRRAGNLLSSDSFNKEKQQRFKGAVDAYNTALEKLVKNGALENNLDHLHQIPFNMVDCILDQVYERAVSPSVRLLTKMKAENTKDNTYGELLHKFVSQIISQTKLKSDQVFVDLGSGVGNVVLQAALEVGCESWGCEMMEAACAIAECQEREFDVRCRLWGIKPGKIHLERGDFRESTATKEAMRRADVILVNNEVFGSDLNQNLIDMFLDLKDGCKIVSLKSFVPAGYKRTPRNTENPVNLLHNETKEYSNNFVSWKDDRGCYYIATKDSTRITFD